MLKYDSTQYVPGPLAFLEVRRPSRRITARSYSFTICTTSEVNVHETDATLKKKRVVYISP